MFPPASASWIGLSLVLLLVALALGNLVLLAGAIFVLLAVLITTTFSPPSGIAVERGMARAVCWTGDTLEVQRRLTVVRGIGPVFVHDELPPELEVTEGNNLQVFWKWPGTKTAELSYRVRFPKRGLFVLPETMWEARPPFETGKGRSGTSGPSIEVSVAPRIRGITRMNEVRATTKRSRYQDDIAKTGASSAEFRELRPYMPGDPIKSINWKASSRGSREDNLPLVNELEPEGRKAVWIFLDVADYMDVGNPLANPMENAVEAAGSLAQYYLSRGSTLGAYAYNSYGGAGELLSPESGRKQFRRLTQMLAGLRSGPPQHDLLQAVEWCKSFLFRLQPEVFAITRLDVHYPRPGEAPDSLDRFTSAIRRMTALRTRSRRHGRVRVVHVSPRELHSASPLSYSEFTMAQWETRPLAATLRRSGAAVIEWDPGREDFLAVMVRHMDAYR